MLSAVNADIQWDRSHVLSNILRDEEEDLLVFLQAHGGAQGNLKVVYNEITPK
jgi:hypothetical protein